MTAEDRNAGAHRVSIAPVLLRGTASAVQSHHQLHLTACSPFTTPPFASKQPVTCCNQAELQSCLLSGLLNSTSVRFSGILCK